MPQPTAEENAKLTLDQFNVSVACRQTLKRMGFENIGEVAEWLTDLRNGVRTPGLIRNLGERQMNEIIVELKLLTLWPFEE